MTASSDAKPKASTRARWVAFGFLGAFAASVLTVIYTGLMVEGSPEEFEAGFRSVTLRVGETRSVELSFDSAVESQHAQLEISLPEAAGLADDPAERSPRRAVAVSYGQNAYTVDLVGRAPGSGYLVARLIAPDPVGIERLFVTVTPE